MMNVSFRVEKKRIIIGGHRTACLRIAKELRGVMKFDGHPWAMRATPRNAAALAGMAESEGFAIRICPVFAELLGEPGRRSVDRAIAHVQQLRYRLKQIQVQPPAKFDGEVRQWADHQWRRMYLRSLEDSDES